MNALKHFRERAGLTQQALADVADTSQPQIRRLEVGERKLTKEWATRLAPHLGITAENLLFPPPGIAAEGDVVEIANLSAQPNTSVPAEPALLSASAFKGPRNVPVLGTGSGGEGSDFRLNGQTVDHAPRPPGITNRQDVYVIYLDGDSIEPAYMDGSPIYVDPHRRPKPKDYVVVELWGENDDAPGEGYVKRLVARRGGKLYLEQHNPPKQLDPIPEEDVKRCHRVIPWPELIGI